MENRKYFIIFFVFISIIISPFVIKFIDDINTNTKTEHAPTVIPPPVMPEDYSFITQDMAAPARPQQDDDLDARIAKSVHDTLVEQAKGAIYAAGGTDPDKHAEVMRYGERFGLAPETIQGALEEIKKQDEDKQRQVAVQRVPNPVASSPLEYEHKIFSSTEECAHVSVELAFFSVAAIACYLFAMRHKNQLVIFFTQNNVYKFSLLQRFFLMFFAIFAFIFCIKFWNDEKEMEVLFSATIGICALVTSLSIKK